MIIARKNLFIFAAGLIPALCWSQNYEEEIAAAFRGLHENATEECVQLHVGGDLPTDKIRDHVIYFLMPDVCEPMAQMLDSLYQRAQDNRGSFWLNVQVRQECDDKGLEAYKAYTYALAALRDCQAVRDDKDSVCVDAYEALRRYQRASLQKLKCYKRLEKTIKKTDPNLESKTETGKPQKSQKKKSSDKKSSSHKINPFVE